MNDSTATPEEGIRPTEDGYVPYSFSADFDGAEPVVEAERRYLEARRDRLPSSNPMTGLALSGGGIRSATFNLGILQCLARRGLLDRIDYLSSVSGGGYIGSSMTWFLQHGRSDTGDTVFNTSEDGFPFGTHRRGKLKRDSIENEPKAEAGGNRYRASALRHLRQNGKYLAPGCGLSVFSLFSVLLRGVFLCLLVFLPLLVLLFVVLHLLHLLRPVGDYPAMLAWFYTWQAGTDDGLMLTLNTPILMAVCITLLGGVISILYSWWTYSDGGSTGRYHPRRRFEIYAGRMTIAVLVLLGVGSLPYVHQLLRDSASQAGFLSIMLGAAAAAASFLKSDSLGRRARQLLPLLVWPAAALLFYGVLLSTYLLAQRVLAGGSPAGWGALIILLFVSLLVGRYTNLNYVAIHRYYRDRLMETYLPNVHDLLKGTNDCNTVGADADRAALSQACDPAAPNGPYHIINCNLVLVNSDIKKYRGRGGDNFILSPAFCGSNATGWLPTLCFMNNRMTLATAMAISGAAANPHTGVGGDGPTRNPVLSLLMSLLNFRLGYWAPNPNPTINRWQLPEHQAASDSQLARLMSGLNPLHGYRPNFFVPTLTATALGGAVGRLIHRLSPKLPRSPNVSEHSFGKNEKNRFIELTDGGHFENLGLYELVRRRLPLIIVCDAAADPDFGFNDLANAIEKVRVDFGASIQIDIEPLVPKTCPNNEAPGVAETACVEGTIRYADNTEARLYYIKTTFFAGLPADLLGYRKSHPDFPDQTTADQFFDEKQFEAYRELGFFSAGLLPDL